MKRESVRQMAKRELHLMPYKLQKVQLLTDENKRVRLQRCRQLKRRAASQRWERILFTDEKLFTVEQAHNHQNDKSWSAEAPGTSAIVEHLQNPQSVMIWGGICASGKTPSRFRGSRSLNQPRSLPTRHSGDCGTSVGPTVLRRRELDVPTGLCLCSQGENDSILVSDPFSGLHRVFGMAALLIGSQPDGLERVVNFRGQGLCYTPHKFGVTEAIAAPGMGSIVARRPAAHR